MFRKVLFSKLATLLTWDIDAASNSPTHFSNNNNKLQAMARYKAILATLTFLASFTLLSGQTINVEQVFSNTHGIKQEGTTFYEVEGYSIFVHNHKASFDDKGFKKIKKKYSINKDILPIVDSNFQTGKVLVKTESRTSKVTQTDIYYLFPHGQGEIQVIGFLTPLKRDQGIERLFVKSILENSIPNSVYSSMIVDSIRFAGRYIVLGPACHWMGTHNIQCPNLGQMNWAEFRNIDRAKEMVEIQYDLTANKAIGEVLQQDTINIIFEGTDIQALKTKYKIKIPQLIMGGSNILIIYYVATEVRGKYVACILSHYTDDVNAKKLLPLLSEVMKLKE